jgi:hypothetical protein
LPKTNAGDASLWHLRETKFHEQIALLLRVTEQLRGCWVVQRNLFDEWRGLFVNPISPEAPLSKGFYPVTGTYATSGEAVDAMLAMQTKYPNCPPLRVVPVQKDINATQLYPGTYDLKKKYGEYPKWGELLRKFPEIGAVGRYGTNCPIP